MVGWSHAFGASQVTLFYRSKHLGNKVEAAGLQEGGQLEQIKFAGEDEEGRPIGSTHLEER